MANKFQFTGMHKGILKKTLACAVAGILALGASAPARTIIGNAAEQTEFDCRKDNQFYYVSIGDSITSGYGIDDAENPCYDFDYARVEYNHKISPAECYPAIIAKNIQEKLTESGYLDEEHSFDWSNLGAPGFMTIDFLNSILDENHLALFWDTVGRFWDEIAKNPKAFRAHDTYVKELAKADLITIHVGSNDLLVQYIVSLMDNLYDDTTLGRLILDTLINLFIFSVDPSEQVNNLVTNIQNFISTTDKATVLREVLAIFNLMNPSSIKEQMTKFSKMAMENYRNLVDAIYELNPHAQLVFLGYFNPFGNSYEYNGVTYTLPGILSDVIKTIADQLPHGINETIDAIHNKTNENIDNYFNFLNNGINGFFGAIDGMLNKLLNKISRCPDESQASTNSMVGDVAEVVDGLLGSGEDYINLLKLTFDPAYLMTVLTKLPLMTADKKEEILSNVKGFTDYLTYPLIHSLGLSVVPAFEYMESELLKISAEYNVPYVYLYDIPNESNPNPHPLTTGHKAIAEKVFAQLVLEPASHVTVLGHGEYNVADYTIMGNNVEFTIPEAEKVVSVRVNGEEVALEDGKFTVWSFNTNTEIEIEFSDAHTYDEGVVTQKATAFKEGNIRYTCTECGHYYDVPIEKTVNSPILNTISKVFKYFKSIFPFGA